MQLVAKAALWLHVSLYRLTNGRIGGRFIAGTPILLLTTTGRRTGKHRTRPLAYVPDEDRYVLCASNGGSPTHPGWYHNLSATGRAEIQVGPERVAVNARTADPAERSRLFPRFVEMYKGYAAYEHKTSRQIPLVLLTPRPAKRNLLKPGGRRPLRCKTSKLNSVTSSNAAIAPLSLASLSFGVG